MEKNREKDTVYLPSEQLENGQEILFQGEIPGIFAEEAVRRHSFSMVNRHFHQSLELWPGEIPFQNTEDFQILFPWLSLSWS